MTKTEFIRAAGAGIIFSVFVCILSNGFNINDEFVSPEPSPVYFINNENEYLPKDRININTADEEKLQRLDGVGEKMSKRIIKYRQKEGEFKQIQDIMKVQGIGKKHFYKIKDSICVNDG